MRVTVSGIKKTVRKPPPSLIAERISARLALNGGSISHYIRIRKVSAGIAEHLTLATCPQHVNDC